MSVPSTGSRLRLPQVALSGLGRLTRGLAASRLEEVFEPRSPLAPAAMRLERTSAGAGDDRANQTAVTVWFGEGPALPTPGSSASAVRAVVRLGVGLVGVAAFAAMSAVAARSALDRERVVRGRLIAPD